jgi:hypothetical protein
MGKWKLAGSTAVIALLAGTSAFADVTPEEVWQNWQDLAASAGETITAESATRDGDALVVSGVSIAYDKDGVKASGGIDEMTFTDQGDGTVEITFADSLSMQIDAPAADASGAPSSMTIDVSLPGAATIASGTADALAYSLDAPTIDMTIKALNASDPAAADATITIGLTNATQNYTVQTDGAAKKMSGEFGADSLKFGLVGTDKETSSDVNVALGIASIAGKINGTFLGADAMKDMAAALKAGFAVDFSTTYGALTLDLTATDATGPTKITGTAESGDTSFGLDINHMQYGAGSKKVALAISSPDIPFPELKVGYDEAAFNMLMPVSKSDQPADVALLTRLVGFTISDEIWGMVDPGAALPHDPATLIIDTKGKVTLSADLMDAAAMEAAGDASPFQLNALDIVELKLAALAAELTGAGSFTFDNSDMTTFQGMPAPTGKADLKLTGANALIDKVVAMGMITQEDAAGYKMMVSMFANSAADKDELTSTLEFKDKGFYANGQRLQ